MSIIPFLHLLFNMVPTPCLLSYFPTLMKMCLWHVSNHWTGLCFHVSFNKIASHLYPSNSITNFSIFLNWVHWPYVLRKQIMKVTSLFFGVFILILNRTLADIFTSARDFLHDTTLCLAQNAASAFLSLGVFLLLLSSLPSLWLFLRHNGTSPSTVRCLSRLPPFPL